MTKETEKQEFSSSFFKFERDTLFPADIAKAQGLNPDTISLLEIESSATGALFKAIIYYAGHYAVDLDIDLKTLPKKPLSALTNSHPNDTEDCSSSSPNSSSDKKKKRSKPSAVATYKSNLGSIVPSREGTGRLSSLWNCPNDNEDNFNSTDISDSEYDSETESYGSDFDILSDEEDEKSAENKEPVLEDENQHGSSDALRKREEPPIQRYHFGFGFAKIAHGNDVIYLHHFGYGLPVPDRYYGSVIRRAVVIVAEEAEILKEFCADVLKWQAERDMSRQRPRPGKFTLWRYKCSGDGGQWENEGYKRGRSSKSIILPEGQLKGIIRDLKDFIAKDTKAWYDNHGLPHRRSYLFHGPPGCGKTSTIKMLAGMFRLNACFLSLSSANFSNEALHDALSTLPRRALLVMEDVDTLFNEDRKSETRSSLTFSGMLNALDGIISVDGCVTVLTTNHIDRLDGAMIRGGRVDRRFEFCHPNPKHIAQLFKSFYEDAPDALATRFASLVMERKEEEARSIATLQQHFIYTRKKNAEECVKLLPEFFAEFYPKGVPTKTNIYL